MIIRSLEGREDVEEMASGDSDDGRDSVQNDEDLLLRLVIEGSEIVGEEAAEVDIGLRAERLVRKSSDKEERGRNRLTRETADAFDESAASTSNARTRILRKSRRRGRFSRIRLYQRWR
jgi:hypothetical protein